MLLVYCPKRNYFAKSWKMRIQLAALHWNGYKGVHDMSVTEKMIIDDYMNLRNRD